MISLPPPTRHLLIQAGYNIVEQDASSLWIKDSIFVTGEVPRTTDFEKGFPNHYSEIDGKMENDPLIKDDQAIIFSIKDKGLVVITGCGHSGIVNILKYAKELTGPQNLCCDGRNASNRWNIRTDDSKNYRRIRETEA